MTVSTLRVESECEDDPDGEEEVGGDQEDEQQQHEEHPQLPRHRGQLHHGSSVPVTTLLSKQRAGAECEGKTCPCFVAGDRRLQVLAGGQVAGSSSHLRLLVTSCPHRPLLGRPPQSTSGYNDLIYKVCVF